MLAIAASRLNVSLPQVKSGNMTSGPKEATSAA
jgi:hypothetical protein